MVETTMFKLFVAVVINFLMLVNAEHGIDENGYVMYCPCMGRFGNQADHFLGSLSFAKKLNRTLIVPPWISHNFKTSYKNTFIPYNQWFKIDPLQRYHRVVAMEDFMENLAPTLWPPEDGRRKIYCHKVSLERSEDKKSCPAKMGNPFSPFWNHFHINFSVSEAFSGYTSYASSKNAWDEAFPVKEHPVLTFMGAPASYPVAERDRSLQQYVEWADEITQFTSEFIKQNLTRPYVGIHLRNGMDWSRACEHVGDGTNHPFMSSPQCVGYGSKSSMFTKEMCMPKSETVLAQVLKIVKEMGARSLFIATDKTSFKNEFIETFKGASLKVDVVKLNYDSLVNDMAILIEADGFVGSCGSSVTAFVVRKRETLEKPNGFFGVFTKGQDKTEL